MLFICKLTNIHDHMWAITSLGKKREREIIFKINRILKKMKNSDRCLSVCQHLKLLNKKICYHWLWKKLCVVSSELDRKYVAFLFSENVLHILNGIDFSSSYISISYRLQYLYLVIVLFRLFFGQYASKLCDIINVWR